jgi:tetratricopeptide (TPR) repeat protein
MLNLLGVPEWRPVAPAVATPQRLPASLPACLLIYLACQARWLDRERLAELFWPDSAHEEARHHLRVNLHRLRQLLAPLGQGESLEAERNRVRLLLPLDLDGPPTDWPEPRQAWLQGFRIGGFGGFWAWSEDFAAGLQRRWEEAAQAGGRSALCGRSALLLSLRVDPLPALVLLGEAGMGKSVALRAAFPQAALLQGREGLAQIPYRPVVELLLGQMPLLRSLLRQTERGLSAYRLDLARLLPELAADEPLPPLDALTARARLLEGLARLLEALGPVLLVDDLQWCDGATLDLLALLAHRGRLRWRGAARGEELTAGQRDWLSQLQQGRCLRSLDLPGLDLPAVREWLRLNDGAAGSDRAERLLAASHGNPFLLGELLQPQADEGLTPGLPPRVRELLLRRWRAMTPAAQQLVAAAAVLARPVPLAALATVAGLDQPLTACREALAAALLREEEPANGGGLQCRHDLVREAVLAALPGFEGQVLHQRAALCLGARAEGDAEPLAVAEHWQAAGEAQIALSWLYRAAAQQKLRGRYQEAQALWQRIATESRDPTLALRSRLSLAECELLHDLPAGRRALQQVLELLGAVADPLQREQIEGQALAGLVDNAVFSGDLAGAGAAAARLRPLLPRLSLVERCNACEVLIELAMREPDIPAAWALLAQLRQLAPTRPSLLSYEGQIHWFGGQVRAARDAFEALLTSHADYCRGLTIENDLAVMLQALGELERAELMARRSLQSWQGVAHTETLSLLVLGLTLTSAGRYSQARAALDRALALAVEQGSALFEAEALSRRAQLWWHCGRVPQALADLDRVEPLLASSHDPLRVSRHLLLRGLVREAQGQLPDAALLARMQRLAQRSSHPLLLIRLVRLQGLTEPAWRGEAARRQIALAREAGLLEPLAEGLLLLAAVSPDGAQPLLSEAAELARRQGFLALLWRAEAGLALHAQALEQHHHAHGAAAAEAHAALRAGADAQTMPAVP